MITGSGFRYDWGTSLSTDLPVSFDSFLQRVIGASAQSLAASWHHDGSGNLEEAPSDAQRHLRAQWHALRAAALANRGEWHSVGFAAAASIAEDPRGVGGDAWSLLGQALIARYNLAR